MKKNYFSLRAEVTLGLQAGYKGDFFSKEAVQRFLEQKISEALAHGERVVPWRIAEASLVYPSEGKGRGERALILSSDRNPRYNADLSDDEWKALVEKISAELGREFKQVRVYVTYTPAEVVIIEEGGEKQ